MKRVSIRELKALTSAEIQANVPLEITSDGSVIAVICKPDKDMTGTMTKCPNCKLEFKVAPTDGRPGFFTTKRIKGGA